MKSDSFCKYLMLAGLSLGLVACGGEKPADKAAAKSDSATKAAPKAEEKAKAPEVKKVAEATELGDYEMKCTEPVAVTSMVFDGVTVDVKSMNKSYAFNFSGKDQLVYLANFEPDMVMMKSGNIDNKKLKDKQYIIKLQFTRTNNKAKTELITTISPYPRVIMSKPESEDEPKLYATMHTKDKVFGSALLGDGMLTGVTKKMVCGKAKMKSERDDKHSFELTFGIENVYVK